MWVAADGEAPRPTALRTTTPVDLSGYEVTREFATSRDGTRIPLNVFTAPGTPRDGTAPALLTAYGGYGISLVPRFDPELLLWLEQGGVYVGASIRGGGEFGEEWHHAGRLATKQNCFDDFIACADHLHDGKMAQVHPREREEGAGRHGERRGHLRGGEPAGADLAAGMPIRTAHARHHCRCPDVRSAFRPAPALPRAPGGME